ncbi:MAG: chemotaxis protein [Campylobacterales bacterium]
MTQEELDALMSQDFEAGSFEGEEAAQGDDQPEIDEKDFRVTSRTQWPPPPPTNEHRVVHQLDEVTRETEEKSSQIFDIMEAISNDAMETEGITGRLKDDIGLIKESFERLHSHFPAIKTFKTQLERCEEMEKLIVQVGQIAQNTNDQIMVAMDVMQFQDIHRQKIERVINVMRALSRYMNSLFDSKVADEKRVSSAVHIAGDHTEEVVDEEDIEALIAAFGGKK